MAKIKIKEGHEVEVDDDVAALVADEGGVPFRNRAAEYRRKMEKMEKAAEAAAAAADAAAATRATEAAATQQPAASLVGTWPNSGGAYVPTYGGQYAWDARTGQYVWVAAQAQGQVQGSAGLTAAEARALAKEELRAARDAEEYTAERARLAEEWQSYDDEKDAASMYLKSKGYSEEQITEFGPRDLRLVHDAMRGAQAGKPLAGRRPQEVILDTGSSGTNDVSKGGLWDDPDKIRRMPRDKFQELVGEARLRPRVEDAE